MICKKISLDVGDLLGPVLSLNPLDTVQIRKRYLEVRRTAGNSRTICWSSSAEGVVLSVQNVISENPSFLCVCNIVTK